MACQGCGRTSPTRLCCPTCIEFGRTSFFCGQECFTKNWNAHNQLHELLRRKRAVAEEGPTGGEAPPAGSVSHAAAAEPHTIGASVAGGSASSTAAAPPTSAFVGGLGSAAGGGRGLGMAPLPGGTSMVNLSKRGSSAAAPLAAPAAAPAAHGGKGPGVFGSLVGHALALIGGSGGTAGAASGALKSRLGGSAPSGRARSPATTRPAGAERRGQSPHPGGRPASPAPRARQFTVQLSLWALAVVTITAAGLFYREHLRYVDGEQPVVAALAVGEPAAQAPATDGALAGVLAVPAAAAAAPADDAGGAAATIGSLRAEVADLRQQLERHDKMFRYIMDRYVEKPNLVPREAPIAGAASTEEHQASAVNLSAPEFVSRSYADVKDEANPRGDALRKRKGVGVGDTVGLPDMG